MKTFTIGDIHGAHKALLQCLERSKFNYDQDRLIVLGDVCDGWPEVNKCFDELLKIKQLDYIIGNHDIWARDWATKGVKEEVWLVQGGYNTVASYKGKMPKAHIDLLQNAHPWIEFDHKLFVHGGFDYRRPLSQQKLVTFAWDRQLVIDARKKSFTDPKYRFGPYERIFVGHTTTIVFYALEPLKFCNVWALDTGAGWNGKLTIMDVATEKYWQSDIVPKLYPDSSGRMTTH